MNALNADLSGQNFDGQDLRNALLRGANLSGCSFVGAKLGFSNIREANIDGTDFTDAELFGCNFKDAIGVAIFTNAKIYGVPEWIPMPDADMESTPPMMNVVREIFIQYGITVDESNIDQIERYYDLPDNERDVLLEDNLEVPTSRNLYISIYGDAPFHDFQSLSKILDDARESNISFSEKLNKFY